jgi:hypothetical protein
MSVPTAEEFLQNYKNDSDHYADQDYSEGRLIKALQEFAKLHVEAALKEASESRCIKMHDKIWFAQSLEPGTKILDRVNITVDKDSILNSYPLDNIK